MNEADDPFTTDFSPPNGWGGAFLAETKPPRPEPQKTCLADACTAEVNPAFIFCTRHWAKVPKAMQTAIWRTYTPGQEYITTQTPEHLDAVRSAVRIIAESEAPRLL